MANDQTLSPQEPLTPAVFYILLSLATSDRHGYDIMKQTQSDSNNTVKMGPGTLYGTIKRLLDAEQITEVNDVFDDELGQNRRRYYRLTPAGRAALGAELQRLEDAISSARRQNILPHHKLQSQIS